jgi:hypothetical protein
MCKRGRYWKLLIIVVSLLVINGILQYRGQYFASGFIFNLRIPSYIEVIRSGSIDIGSETFSSFLFSPGFISSLSLITGLDLLDVFYLPINSIVGFSFYLYACNKLFDDNYIIILVAFSTFLFNFGTVLHYTEYIVGTALYIVIATVGFRYFITGDKRFGVASLILFISVKMFNPHAEIWYVSFIAIYVLFASYVQISKNNRRTNTYILIILLLVFSYNDKIYGQLVGGLLTNKRELLFREEVINFLSVVLPLGTESSSTGAFITRSFSPPLLKLTNAAYYVLILLGLTFSIIIYIFIYKSNNNFNHRDIFSFSIVFALVPDTILIFGFGNTSYTIFRAVGPLLFIHSMTRLDILFDSSNEIYSQKVSQAVKYSVVILVFLVLISQVSYFVIGVPSKTPNIEQTSQMMNFDEDRTNIQVLTAYDEFGVMRSVSAIMKQELSFRHVEFTTERYRYLIGNSTVDPDFDMIIISDRMNRNSFNGDGTWREYESTGKYQSKINRNQNIATIYDIGEYKIYNTNR